MGVVAVVVESLDVAGLEVHSPPVQERPSSFYVHADPWVERVL